MSDLSNLPAPSVCVVLIHYFTPDLLEACVASIRASDGFDPERTFLIVVDNGSDEGDRDLLDSLGVTILRPGTNLGYAGAINLAVKSRSADIYLVMNPDIEVDARCVQRLVEKVRTTDGIAAPRLFIDRNRRFALPPTERRTLPDELLRAAALWNRFARRIARRRWRRHARRHIQASGPVPSHYLSGAMLAIPASAFRRVGLFDEAYQLYYEETDWLLRARRAGIDAAYVPDATGIHIYNQSARKEARAKAWFRASEQRFRRRHYGRFATLLLNKLENKAQAEPDRSGANRIASLVLPDWLATENRDTPMWVEISPSPAGFPAASARCAADELTAVFEVAKDLLIGLESDDWRLTITDAGGRERWSAEFRGWKTECRKTR